MLFCCQILFFVLFISYIFCAFHRLCVQPEQSILQYVPRKYIQYILLCYFSFGVSKIKILELHAHQLTVVIFYTFSRDMLPKILFIDCRIYCNETIYIRIHILHNIISMPPRLLCPLIYITSKRRRFLHHESKIQCVWPLCLLFYSLFIRYTIEFFLLFCKPFMKANFKKYLHKIIVDW